MEQTSKPAETPPQAKGKRTWVIIGAVVIVLVVVVGLYLAGYFGGIQFGGQRVSIWENPVGSCGNSTQCGFNPTPLNMALGTTVRWTNDGTQPHNVYSCDSQNSPSTQACPNGTNQGAAANVHFASSIMNTGDTFDFRFDTAGTYAYYCNIHPFMHATIVVT